MYETMNDAEVIELLGLNSPNALTRLVNSGGLPCVPLPGENRVFLRVSVMTWLIEREEAADGNIS